MSATLTALDRRPHFAEQLAEFAADLDTGTFAKTEPRQHRARGLHDLRAALDLVVWQRCGLQRSWQQAFHDRREKRAIGVGGLCIARARAVTLHALEASLQVMSATSPIG